MNNIYRSFGVINHRSTKMLQILSKVYSGLNCLFRILWGFVFDKVGYFPIFLFCSVSQVLICGFFFFTRNNDILYFTINILAVISFTGNTISFSPLIGKIFGVQNSPKLVGITLMGIGTAALSAPIIIHFFVKKVAQYIIFFMVDVVFGIIAGILTFQIGDDSKFDYNPDADVGQITDKFNETLKDDL